VEILNDVKRELLLVFKTNNYLRAIDNKLGNPTNTYNIINNLTWKIYTEEVAFKAEKTSRLEFYKNYYFYYLLKLALGLNVFRIKLMAMVGIKASKEELEDFDLDYNE